MIMDPMTYVSQSPTKRVAACFAGFAGPPSSYPYFLRRWRRVAKQMRAHIQKIATERPSAPAGTANLGLHFLNSSSVLKSRKYNFQSTR